MTRLRREQIANVVMVALMLAACAGPIEDEPEGEKTLAIGEGDLYRCDSQDHCVGQCGQGCQGLGDPNVFPDAWLCECLYHDIQQIYDDEGNAICVDEASKAADNCCGTAEAAIQAYLDARAIAVGPNGIWEGGAGDDVPSALGTREALAGCPEIDTNPNCPDQQEFCDEIFFSYGPNIDFHPVTNELIGPCPGESKVPEFPAFLAASLDKPSTIGAWFKALRFVAEFFIPGPAIFSQGWFILKGISAGANFVLTGVLDENNNISTSYTLITLKETGRIKIGISGVASAVGVFRVGPDSAMCQQYGLCREQDLLAAANNESENQIEEAINAFLTDGAVPHPTAPGCTLSDFGCRWCKSGPFNWLTGAGTGGMCREIPFYHILVKHRFGWYDEAVEVPPGLYIAFVTSIKSAIPGLGNIYGHATADIYVYEGNGGVYHPTGCDTPEGPAWGEISVTTNPCSPLAGNGNCSTQMGYSTYGDLDMAHMVVQPGTPEETLFAVGLWSPLTLVNWIGPDGVTFQLRKGACSDTSNNGPNQCDAPVDGTDPANVLDTLTVNNVPDQCATKPCDASTSCSETCTLDGGTKYCRSINAGPYAWYDDVSMFCDTEEEECATTWACDGTHGYCKDHSAAPALRWGVGACGCGDGFCTADETCSCAADCGPPTCENCQTCNEGTSCAAVCTLDGVDKYCRAIDVDPGGGGTTLYFESFESGSMTSWVNVTGDDQDWTVDQGGTPSGSTGPSTGANGTSWYAYTESSGNGSGYPSKHFWLESPTFAGGGEVNFYWHMYGSSIGSLHLDVYDGTQWINDVWERAGDNGDVWVPQTVSLAAYSGTIKLRFRGISGTSYQSDTALDEIEIVAAPPEGCGGPCGQYRWKSATDVAGVCDEGGEQCNLWAACDGASFWCSDYATNSWGGSCPQGSPPAAPTGPLYALCIPTPGSCDAPLCGGSGTDDCGNDCATSPCDPGCAAATDCTGVACNTENQCGFVCDYTASAAGNGCCNDAHHVHGGSCGTEDSCGHVAGSVCDSGCAAVDDCAGLSCGAPNLCGTICGGPCDSGCAGECDVGCPAAMDCEGVTCGGTNSCGYQCSTSCTPGCSAWNDCAGLSCGQANSCGRLCGAPSDPGCGTCTTNAECDDGNVCTDDVCNASSCQNTNNTASCNDGDACTTADTCAAGACSGSAFCNGNGVQDCGEDGVDCGGPCAACGGGTTGAETATSDAHTRQLSPDNNYGSMVSMKTKGGGSKKFHSFVKFDLSAHSGPVSQATLQLYVVENAFNVGDVEVRECTDGWDEATITWNNKPAAGSLIGTADNVAEGTTISIDVTSFVNAELAGDKTVSFALRENGDNSSNTIKWGTKDSGTPAQHPTLLLE